MHILCITLTGKQNQGARAIQMAKVIRALQDQGAYVTVITRQNDKLAGFNHRAGRIMYVDPAKDAKSSVKNKSLIGKLAGSFFPEMDHTTRLAVTKALEVAEKEKPDCIFSSSNPVSSHFAGLRVAEITGLPWLASFSDPKPTTMLPPPYGSRLKRLIPKGYTSGLKKVLQQCDAVHMPTGICLEITEKFYNISLSGKGYAIPPVGETDVETERRLTSRYLVHLGSITKRLSEAFSRAVADFAEENPEKFEGVLFVGKHHRKTRALMNKYGLGAIIKTKPQVPHKEALTIVSNAGAVLILEADMSFSHALPSKFAESAFSGTPILAVTPARSAIREYLNRYGGGVAATHSREEILAALREIFGKDPVELTRMATEQKALSENFTFDAVGKSYMEVLTRLTDRK